MKNYKFVMEPQTLIETMLHDVGNGPVSINGDRSSRYFIVAKEKGSGEAISAALIENKAYLKESEWFYSVHVIDDITMADCELICTDGFSRIALNRSVEEMYDSLGKRLRELEQRPMENFRNNH